MYISVLLPSILALIALYKNKLTLPGLIAAWIMGIIITYFGGISAFIALALTFILTIMSDKLKKTKEDKRRNIYQIFSNVLTCSVSLVLYYFFKNEVFIVVYYAVIGGSLADTLASSIGPLAKEKPIHPLTLKKMEIGESGAISILGLVVSLLGGLIIGVVYYFTYFKVLNLVLISLMGLFGSYVDSLLGALFQAKYECNKCHEYTENSIHCGLNAKLIKGIGFINNNAVNFSSNVIIFLITLLLYV